MDNHKLLIIGAGASGIAAACKLLEYGFNDFKILEAENRIGGRVNTVNLGSEPVELGAEWIHGEVDNAVYELASKYNLADNNSPFYKFENTTFYDFSGCQINKEISTALWEIYNEIIRTDGSDLDKETLNGSVGTYFDNEFQKKIDKLKKQMNLNDNLWKKFIKTFENWENSIDASHSWYETSLSGHLEYWECDGNSLTRWKNNRYDTVFNLLMEEVKNLNKETFLQDKVIYNKEVVKIKWNKERKPYAPSVEIECLDGTVYYAEHVLITCSLGVLKERASEMFSPGLPELKIKCIENLGFGTVDKIFVKFTHRWWGNDVNGVCFLWSEEERKNDTSGWLNGVICFHPISPTSLILRGWVTGETARHMETLSNSEIANGINSLFDKFLGNTFKVPPVEVCLPSKWYSNCHFRGSYSCRLMKSESSDVWACQLAESVCDVNGKPILFFGGEATHDHYFSTVHGAIEAGRREAEKLLPIVIAKSPVTKYCQVVIVGAGISGLAAAKTLFKNGVSDILILEAQSQPGGRIRSLHIDEYCLELGAQWIHGDKNEVYEICQENELLTDEFSCEGAGLYLRENGERIDDKIVREVDDIVKDILESCEDYVLTDSKTNVPSSIGEELEKKFNEYLDNCQDTEEVKNLKKELFDWHIRFLIIDNSCWDVHNLSAKAWGLFKYCGGSEYVNFKNGYSSLIDFLVGSLPSDMILYETCVEKIDWAEKIKADDSFQSSCHSPNYCVKISCNNGITCFCQYVIVTSSIGYLKKNYKTMFSPSLPKYLSEAIEYFGFGVIDKIFLIYNKAWWDANTKGFQLVWSNVESNQSDKHWGRYVTGFDVIFTGKPVLLGWVGGEGAKMIEQMSESEVGLEATEILRKFTRNPKIPLPDRVIRTKWWSNEYVRGAYSHVTVKCDEGAVNGSNLARPVYTFVEKETETFEKPTIILAGESTHKNHFSTVHGAYESGISQAQVILNHIESLKS